MNKDGNYQKIFFSPSPETITGVFTSYVGLKVKEKHTMKFLLTTSTWPSVFKILSRITSLSL